MQILQAVRKNKTLGNKTTTCRKCGKTFKNRREWYEHNELAHKSEQLKDYPWLPGPSPFDLSENADDLLTYTEFMVNKNEILEPDRDITAVFSTYNYPMLHVTNEAIEQQMWEIYRKQDRAYKLNLSPGYILQSTKTDDQGAVLPTDQQEFRYFSPGGNNHILEDPVVIKNVTDLEKAIAAIQALNILEFIKRPTSAYILRVFCQLKYYVYKLPRALGAGTPPLLPYYITRNEQIFTQLETRQWCVTKAAHPNICMFTSIAQAEKYKQTKNVDSLVNVKKRAMVLYQKFANFALQNHLLTMEELDLDKFKGVKREHIAYVENVLDVSVNILSINEIGEAVTRFTSSKRKDASLVVYMNEYNDHLNFIIDIDKYCSYYSCSICDRLFKTKANMERHMRVCQNKSFHVFRGGFKHQHKSIFERLGELGIHVQDRIHNAFAVWDLEARLPKCNIQPASCNLKYTARHVANCAAVCSNVPNFEHPEIIIENDEQILVDKMLVYLTKIREEAAKRAYSKWGWVLDRLDELINDREMELANKHIADEVSADLDEVLRDELDCVTTGDIQDERCPSDQKRKKVTDAYLNMLRKYKVEMCRFMSQLIVLSFAGSSYDFNLVRGQIANTFVNEYKHEVLEEKAMDENDKKQMYNDVTKGLLSRTGETYVIKRSNRHICISNLKFKLLDITSYLSVGVTYKQFVDMFGSSSSKFHAFPYEWWQTYEQLEQDHLPPYPSSHWWSSLKQCDLLSYEHETWKSANDPSQPEPLTGYQKFAEIKELWEREKWVNMKSFLRKYAECDVLPFIQGVSNFMDLWHKEQVNVFKETVSLPALANILLWRQSIKDGYAFPLFSERDKDLHYCIRKNIAAGQSLVVNRFQEANLTKISKDSDQITQSLTGVDACSLYGGCMGMDIPINSYVRRFAHTNFRAEPMSRMHMMFVWLKHVEASENVHIISRQTHGYEIQISSFYCDGFSTVWSEDEQKYVYTIYEYMGCYWHGHSDPLQECSVRRKTKTRWPEEKYIKTLARLDYLRSMGYCVRVMWECSFLKMLEENEQLRAKVNMFRPEFYSKHPSEVSESRLLQAIANDELFGLILVNVSVIPEYSHIYDQFPVLFANTEIFMKDLCPNTRKFVEENNLQFKSKKLLMSENNARNLLISSEYARWLLLQRHFKIEILEVVEFCRAKVFNKFVHFVTEQRHAAATNKDLRLFANTYKTLLCASYGMMLLNKSKFEQTKYMNGSENVRSVINDEKFRRLTYLGQENYEISMAPRRIVQDTCCPIGIFVLSRAKKIMLTFLYTFLYKFISPKVCSVSYHDTDSYYLSCSFPTLADAVRAEKKAEFNKMVYGRCGEKQSFEDVTFFFPRKCCNSCQTKDLLTPFVFKEEFYGDLLLAVSSKTYLARSKDQFKISSKGVSVATLKKNDPEQIFRNTIQNKKPYFTSNRGFRIVRDGIVSYSQFKLAFSYLYIKRGLHNEPFSDFTYALGLTLDNAPQNYICIQTDRAALSIDHEFPFSVENHTFNTVRQAFVYSLAKICNEQSIQADVQTTTSSVTLMKLYKSCDRKVKALLKLNSLKSCLTAKLEACSATQHDLHTCTTLPLNMEVDRYLGTGESLRVAKWMSNSSDFGGQNKVGSVWFVIRKNRMDPTNNSHNSTPPTSHE